VLFKKYISEVEEVTVDVVETARELELEVEPEDVTELLQSHDKNLTDEELLLMDEERKWFLEIETAPAEDAVKIVKMTTKDLEYYIKLVDCTVGFEKIDSNFEKCSVVGKCYQTVYHATEKLVIKGRVNQCGKLHYCLF